MPKGQLVLDHLIADHRAIDQDPIAALVPHSGQMVLLDGVSSWDGGFIACWTRSHLDPENPLRRAGRLDATCGIEYALQAAALHGGLMAGGVPQPAGYLAALRDVSLHTDRLDDAAIGDLQVIARMEHLEAGGLIYAFELRSQAGRLLLSGRAIIALPREKGT
jgi:predicted hotdog family 3-hydroxylacyl-ACP dehydratase